MLRYTKKSVINNSMPRQGFIISFFLPLHLHSSPACTFVSRGVPPSCGFAGLKKTFAEGNSKYRHDFRYLDSSHWFFFSCFDPASTAFSSRYGIGIKYSTTEEITISPKWKNESCIFLQTSRIPVNFDREAPRR